MCGSEALVKVWKMYVLEVSGKERAEFQYARPSVVDLG